MAGPHQRLRIQVRATALATNEARTKTVYNVYDYYRTTSGGSPSKAAAVTAFKTAVLTPLANCLSVSYVKQYLDARFLDDPLDPYLTTSDGVNGAVAGDSLPSVNNVTMRLTSGVRGANWQGRKHYGPIAESHTLLDYLTSAAITLWGTFQTAYLAGFSDGAGTTWLPFIVSADKSFFDPVTATVVGVPVTGTIVNAYLGIMRKRSQERANTM